MNEVESLHLNLNLNLNLNYLNLMCTYDVMC